MTDPTQPPSYTPPPAESGASASAPAYGGGEYGAPAPVPGKVLGIVAFIGSIVIFPLSVLWIILGIVAVVQTRKVGQVNGFGIAAIIIGVIGLIVSIFLIIGLVALFTVGNELYQACSDAGFQGTVQVQGQSFDCSELQQSSN